MDLVERYINDKPGNENKVKISNGWWEKFMKRNPSLHFRSGDSIAEVRMNAVNSENILIYSKKCSRKISLLTTQKLFTTWMRLECR